MELHLILSVAFLAIFLFLISGAVYRLYLCPISSFPGPRLAALTFWYEFYYDVIQGGRYTWEIEKMHKKYGPIIRINPYELHIDDPEFYDEIYVGLTRRTVKWEWSAKMFGTTLAAVGTAGHELHRLRRSALNPFFSKRSITRLESVLQENIDKLTARLREFKDTEKPVNLVDAFTSLSADSIGSFAFGSSYGFLEMPDFNPRWHKFMMELSRSTHLMKQFGWLYTILTILPQRLVSLLHPLTRELFALQASIANQIRSIQSAAHQSTQKGQVDSSPSEREHRTLIDHLGTTHLLPPNEITVTRLTDEGLTLIGAGTVTTAWTLSVTVYHLLSNPAKLCRLRCELAALTKSLNPPNVTRTQKATWRALEQLPYLTAVISEGLRLSYGISHRLARISPDTPLYYHHHKIDPGVPVSMTQMLIHKNGSIFPEPYSFSPERWLSDSPEDLARMKHFLVPFSRGTRQCVGINLAYAELFLTLGALFGANGINLELSGTSMKDVDCVHDYFNPAPRSGSKGIRVLVRS
ncbi:putative P450 monooxygenase [Glonium stellatum]|uniref:Putative P450 monooxygenase n=1 Tax=Glonium stellatum TaxID=574774 RepID=A0A8E2EYB1_9PEZI|nr:putative P450 monooxygenase [Glonium stellatum]